MSPENGVSLCSTPQVLINAKRFIKLYLPLKIPAMLMGEVVSDIPARPGSAAVSAPLRLERYLAIGCNCIGGAVRMASLCGGLFLKLVVRDHSLARHVRWRLSQHCSHGTLICYAPIRTYPSHDAAFKWSHEVQVRCEVQRTMQFPCAFAFKANLHIAFNVLDKMVLMSGSEFNKLVREIETRSEKEPLVVSSIDAGNVVVFSRAFYAACSLFHDEKPPQLARGTCLVPSTQHLCYTRPAHLWPFAGPLREQEFAIRMSFRDDNLDKLSFTLNLHSSLDALLDAVVGSFLHQGVYDVMKLTDCPSATQIRYAGSKGMLCINHALPYKKLLCLRPSMQKFPCASSEYLDVVKVSASRSVTFNQPLIKILEQLGVRTDRFIRLQENIQFTDVLVEQSSAVNVLAAWSKLPLPYEDLSKAGFQLALDPFFRSLLLAVYRNAVAGLQYKTRLVLPLDRARNMLGVVDTTSKLRYGETSVCWCPSPKAYWIVQVFVQFTEIRRPRVQYHELPKRTVITGTVLVTKCPCLHPGDVRKFTAIAVPELHHVIDCIVFPHGPRPHPDEMAGSDLDGDEYIVIWEKCLFFVVPKRPPMNFSDRNPEPDNKEIAASLVHE
ncbi:hypothetical protein HPB49_005942 [Dermacentor silvarum]|uniref:Uncharacterized protein n=1 Tax=Dermacentor silvarum TaxID=543639 RepID=A0ACB8DVW3_DERSI|nr:hypothetical protein HPB49_005942 [Dermacentor silvarum]